MEQVLPSLDRPLHLPQIRVDFHRAIGSGGGRMRLDMILEQHAGENIPWRCVSVAVHLL